MNKYRLINYTKPQTGFAIQSNKIYVIKWHDCEYEVFDSGLKFWRYLNRNKISFEALSKGDRRITAKDARKVKKYL